MSIYPFYLSMDPFVHLYIDPFIHLSVHLSESSSTIHLPCLYRIYLSFTQKRTKSCILHRDAHVPSRHSASLASHFLDLCTILGTNYLAPNGFEAPHRGFFKKKRRTFQNRGRIRYLYHTNGATKLSSWELTYHLF